MAIRTAPLAFALLTLCAAAPLSAQENTSRQFTAAAGTLTYDASGTGSTFTVAVRASQLLHGRWLGAELGLAYAPLDEQFSDSPTHVAALDAQLQFRLPIARIEPYLGVGPGFVSYLTQAAGRRVIEGAVSGGAGVRIPASSLLGIVVDGRVRGWRFAGGLADGPVNAGAELTAGLSYRF